MTTTERLNLIDSALYGEPTDKERNEAMESLTALRATLAAMEQQQSQTTALLLAEMRTAIELRAERAALIIERDKFHGALICSNAACMTLGNLAISFLWDIRDELRRLNVSREPCPSQTGTQKIP